MVVIVPSDVEEATDQRNTNVDHNNFVKAPVCSRITGGLKIELTRQP